MSPSATNASPLPSRPRIERLDETLVRCCAPAKLNLNLLVGVRGEDGYHPLDSIVATVTLYDQIDLRGRGDGEIRLSVTGLECGPAEDNLAARAAKAFQCECGTPGVDVALTKMIPPGRGLGGGSSDAAAVLAGMREVLGLSVSDQELADIGASLGSDVPLFLGPPALRMVGRGEVIEPVTIHDFAAVLVLPAFECSTVAVYAAYAEDPTPIGSQVDLGDLATGLPSAWSDRLTNDLAEPAMRACPELAELYERLVEAVPGPVHVTGSGSGLFVLFNGPGEASAVAGDLRRTIGQDVAEIVVVQPARGQS